MNLRERLQRMLQIVEESERAGALADIERDILLAELRDAYAELKFGALDERRETRDEREESLVAEFPIVPSTPADEAEDDESDEPEVEVELIFDEEEIEESSEEIEDESEEIEETLSTLNSQLSTPEEPVVEELPATPTTPIVEETVEVGKEEIVEDRREKKEELSSLVSRLSSKNPLLSLYEDEPTPVLGEQFHEAPSVADTIACPKGVAESTPIASLRDGIGVADKFMLVRELFGGDADACERAIDALEAQPSFDDCIIYIAENYTWSPNSQATKLVMELLQRKYNA